MVVNSWSLRLGRLAYQGYSYKEWYDSMNDWLAKRIVVEAMTPITSPMDSTLISTVSADSALPVEPKKSSNLLLIIGAILVILLMSRGKES
jgi:hypothetical protein